MGKRRLYLEQRNTRAEDLYFSIRKKSEPLLERVKTNLHWHDYYEIELIADGDGEHLFNGKSYPLHRGCAYLLSPKDFHSVRESDQTPLSLYNINFNEQILPSELKQQLNSANGGICVTFDEEETVQLCQLLESMLTEHRSEAQNSREMVNALFVQFLIILLRKDQKSMRLTLQEEKKQPQVSRVISHLKMHFREPITLYDCARMVYLTPNYLGEIFCRETGMSFQQYLRKLRFDYAVNLLCVSDVTVEEISLQSGFPSASYFAYLFRKEYHMTPTQYRAAQRRSV